LRVAIGLDADADAAELYDEAQGLQQELLDLDVERVEREREGPPPAGARAVDAALVGSLVVTATRQAVQVVAHAVVQWVTRRPQRKVKLKIGEDEIELTAVSTEDQRRLLETFLARHAAPEA
jgi:hypothetical protein